MNDNFRLFEIMLFIVAVAVISGMVIYDIVPW